jgi:hypothetical protein
MCIKQAVWEMQLSICIAVAKTSQIAIHPAVEVAMALALQKHMSSTGC